MTPRRQLLLILLLALGLRLLLWSQPLHQPANDEHEYIAVARDLAAGRGWQLYERFEWLRAPLYPLFLAGSLLLARGDLHLAALPNIALSVATVYLVFRLTRALVGERPAPLAALLLAVLWTHATFASLYMSETLFTFLFTAGLLMVVEGVTTDSRRPVLPTPVAAGVLFGLAALTRSAVLPFLPVLALWLLGRQQATGNRQQAEDAGQGSGINNRQPGATSQESGARSQEPGAESHTAPPAVGAGRARSSVVGRRSPVVGLLAVFLFALSFCLTISPWTIRNYLAYGRPILIETGLSFNLWFFNEPRESNNEIYETLASIPNPAERADYATQRGLERLREDPGVLLRRMWPNWTAVWRVKPIEDRFLVESYNADVDFPLFAAALLLDDALYLLILLAAIAGLVLRRQPSEDGRRARPIDPKWLAIGWVLCVAVTAVLTHGEARYRHFFFTALIPYAAWMLTRMRGWNPALGDQRSSRSGISNRQSLTVAALAGLALFTFLPAYPWPWAERGLARSWHAQVGDLHMAAGHAAGAIAAYGRALDVDRTADGWLRLGAAAAAAGDIPRALDAYREAVEEVPSYVPAHGRLGDLLRSIGDLGAARTVFGSTYQEQLTGWAWRELAPPPASSIDVGGGLDFGYVAGVYSPEEQQEETARWTDGRGQIHLSLAMGAGSGPALVRLRLAAPHPGLKPVAAEICAAGTCRPLTLGPTWRTYVLPFDLAAGEAVEIEVRSETFAVDDGRTLGVLIDRVSVV